MPGAVTIGRKRPLPTCPNPLFLEWLSEWRDAAADKGKKSQFVYQKAISSLKKYPLPLRNGKEAKILQNFGDGICKMLDEKLTKHYAEHGPDAPIHNLVVRSSTETSSSKKKKKNPKQPEGLSFEELHTTMSLHEKGSGIPTPTKKKTTQTKKTREYVPQKRSGGYAVLLTLFKDSKPDPGSKYTAWSSVSTLIQKSLVIKTHNPARYSLTEKGVELAGKLDTGEEVLRSTVGDGKSCGAGAAQKDEEESLCPAVNQEAPSINHPYEGKETCMEKEHVATYTFEEHEKVPVRSTGVENPFEHLPEFTLQPGQFDIILCVDFIETTGGSTHRKQELVAELKRNGVSFDVRKLHVGDFLWIAQERVRPVPGQLRAPTARELVLDYVVERKRMDDLCGSIIDGRFREQKFRMKRCGLRNPIYLVEDYGSAQHLSIPEGTLQQAIVNTQVVDGFFIKRTKDVRESAAYLTIMTRYLQNLYLDKILLSCNKEEAAKCDRSFSTCSDSCVLMTFAEFNEGAVKNKAQTVKEVFARQLMQISGVSGEKAAAILEKYDTLASLLNAYKECRTVEEQEKLLSNIKCGKLQRNLGPALSKTLSQLYCTDGALS
ncbi:crossover junction endonuclease MUS81 isoform X2 [Ambystoma mexicanum]|uniref:crossover junction endonuclease MUS81 isoform X2 n=1 Tax=Ambystoma mexicanum TaxID=8296 RepID=UPI0037E70D1A